MKKKYYKISEVSEIYGVHHDTVKKWCINGDMEANFIGGTWYIPIEATESYEKGLKPKRVLALEKDKEALQKRIEALERVMREVAGTLLKGEI